MPTTRRAFFKIIGALPLVAALARTAPAAETPPAQATRLLLNRFSIAGFQYYDGPALVQHLRPGQELIREIEFDNGNIEAHIYKGIRSRCLTPGAEPTLTREPHNPHDPFAVAIHLGQAKLGYVPRSDNKHLSRLLAQGARLTCRVIEVDSQSGVWDRVRVEVWMI